MDTSQELKKIKKMYGENFMKLCRSLFPTILEKEGRLYEILTSTFSGNSRTLYEDIVNEGLENEFKNYIYSKIDVEDPEMEIIEERTPYEILEEAGYDLVECFTEEEIQKFRKYYKSDEELCTFNGNRLDRCIVFFAVKKDVENIKREDFRQPKREDAYGTSVMGIQFNKQGICTVSIKNRYNSTVNNPDATYGNDLDRIAPGLTKSFSTLLEKEYGLELDSSNVERLKIPGYIVARDGKYYKYNMEIEGIYYCANNVIIDHEKIKKLKNPKMLVDYYIIDTKNKTIQLYDLHIRDSFINTVKRIEKIEIVKSKEANINKVITIYIQNREEPILIGIDKNNQMVTYKNNNVVEIEDDFCCENKALKEIILQNTKWIGRFFCGKNKALTEINLPNAEKIADGFCCGNERATKVDMPKVKKIGMCFFRW